MSNEQPELPNLIYKPSDLSSPPLKSTLGVKFCKDVYLDENFLKNWNIPYDPKDLESGIFGPCIRVKRD